MSSRSAPSQLQRNNTREPRGPAPIAGISTTGILRGDIATKFGGRLQLADAGGGVMAAAASTQKVHRPAILPESRLTVFLRAEKLNLRQRETFYWNWMPLGAMARRLPAYESAEPGRRLPSKLANQVRRRKIDRNSSQLLFAVIELLLQWDKKLLT